MQKSFLGYYLDRIEKRIGIKPSNTEEMAAPAATFQTDSGKEVSEEARKTPVFIDQADLQFLQQFPPSLWKQALAWRYGPLLEAAWEAKEAGKKFPEVQNVTLYYRAGRKKKSPVIFPKVQTGANALLHRITADVDDVMLSQLTPDQKDQYIDHARKNKLGSLGYVLSGIKKGKGMAASKGYVFPGENDMRKRLAGLYKAHSQGWYGKPEGETRSMNFGGGGKVKVPVYSANELAQMPGVGERYDIGEDGKRIWYAFDQETGEPIEIDEHLPKLNPGVMVPTDAVQAYERGMNWHQQLQSDFEEGNIDEYREVFEDPKALDEKIRELKIWMRDNPRPPRGQDPMRGQRMATRRALKRLLNIPKIVANLEQRVCQGQDDCESLLDPDEFYQRLHGMIEPIRAEAEQARDQASRYDVDDWNIHHWNPNLKNPHTGWTGFGTWNPNWQQPRRAHGGLQRLGLEPQEVWDSVKDYLVQAGSKPGDEDHHTAEIPYTKSWDDKDEIEMGALAKGINGYLQRGDIYGTPSWYAITKNWWEVFENAADYMRRQIGSGHFLDYGRYLKARKEGKPVDVDLKKAYSNMAQFAYQSGYNYAGMIHQLKNRMGGGVSPGGIDLGSILDDPSIKGDMEAMAGAIVSRWNRANRPEDPRFATAQDHGRTSHAISLIHELIDDEQVNQAVDQAVSRERGTVATAVSQLGPDSDAKERQLTKNIIDTGLAFMVYRHIYIYQKSQAGEQWNIRDANEFASRALDKWLQKRGIRPFGGNIQVGKGSKERGTGAFALAKRQAGEEEAYRNQMSDMGYQDRVAAKEQEPGRVAPQVADDHHTQAQQLLAMVKLIDNIHVLRQLHPESPKYNPKLRSFYEKMVQDRSLGWPILKVLLRRVDGLSKEKLKAKSKKSPSKK